MTLHHAWETWHLGHRLQKCNFFVVKLGWPWLRPEWVTGSFEKYKLCFHEKNIFYKKGTLTKLRSKEDSSLILFIETKQKLSCCLSLFLSLYTFYKWTFFLGHSSWIIKIFWIICSSLWLIVACCFRVEISMLHSLEG